MRYHAPYGSTDPDAPYVDRDTPGAVRGSVPPAAAIEVPQREIVDFIVKSGQTPDDPLQLANAVQSGKVNYAAAGGSANALTATLSPVPSGYAAGLFVRVKAASTNTGAVTINLNGLGAKNIIYPDGTPLKPFDIASGSIMEMVYDGTSFQLVSKTTRVIYADLTKTVAASGGDFTSIAAAMDWLSLWRIAPGAVVTIQVAAGVYPLSAVSLDHPDGGQIIIAGTMIGTAPVYADFTLTGASVPQRASDNGINLAMVRAKYGTEFQVPSDFLGVSVSGGGGAVTLKDALLTGTTGSTPIDVASGGLGLQNVAVYGGQTNIKVALLGFISASDCWSFGAEAAGWAAFVQSTIFGSGLNAFSNGDHGFYIVGNSALDVGAVSRANTNGQYGFLIDAGVMSAVSTSASTNGLADTRAQNNARVTMLSGNSNSPGSTSPAVNTLGNANSYIAN